MRLSKVKKSINVVSDEIGSPTYSLDLSLAIRKLITSKRYGMYHISNAGYASRYEFAKKAFLILGRKDVQVNPIKLKDYHRLSMPPLNTSLISKKTGKLGINLVSWDIALKKFLKSQNYE